MRTIIYVDGFNLFYGQLKGRPNKWLDLRAFSNHLVDSKNTIVKIKYFTARVSGANDLDAPRNQAVYFKALRTLPEVEIHFGSFLAKTIWRPSINIPVGDDQITYNAATVTLPPGNHTVAGSRPSVLPVGKFPKKGGSHPSRTEAPAPGAIIVKVHAMEEKGSDVNIASHLVNDACLDLFDTAVVVSNDTDLVTPIRMVVEKGKPVTVACPSKSGVAEKLRRAATSVIHIHTNMLTSSQFPCTLPGTTISRPSSW